MIIGHGDIASVLPDKKGWIFFASGVSNSGETRESEYKREKDLLMKQDKKRHIVYFSSLSIFYRNTRYTRHKKKMEDIIRSTFRHYTILRLGNITWGKNPHTFINYFYNHLKSGKKLDIWDTYRYPVNKEEFLHWISLIPAWNCELNITGERMRVADIVKKYVYPRLHSKKT